MKDTAVWVAFNTFFFPFFFCLSEVGKPYTHHYVFILHTYHEVSAFLFHVPFKCWLTIILLVCFYPWPMTMQLVMFLFMIPCIFMLYQFCSKYVLSQQQIFSCILFIVHWGEVACRSSWEEVTLYRDYWKSPQDCKCTACQQLHICYNLWRTKTDRQLSMHWSSDYFIQDCVWHPSCVLSQPLTGESEIWLLLQGSVSPPLTGSCWDFSLGVLPWQDTCSGTSASHLSYLTS